MYHQLRICMRIKKILYLGAVLVLFNPSDGIKVFAADSSSPSQPVHQSAVKEIPLHECTDDRMAVKFLCNPDWKLETKENTLFIIIEETPSVTLTIARSDSPVIFLKQLTKPVLQEMGQYEKDFQTQDVKLNNSDALMVSGYSKDHPDLRLLDYYLIHDVQLYSILFAVAPKERWDDYEELIKKIVGSIEFLK